jgi:hypothetical protein
MRGNGAKQEYETEEVGHVMRMKVERVSKKARKGYVEGRRAVVRPRERWLDGMGRDGSKGMVRCRNCRRSAEDKNGWRPKIEEATAQSRLKRHNRRRRRRRRKKEEGGGGEKEGRRRGEGEEGGEEKEKKRRRRRRRG